MKKISAKIDDKGVEWLLHRHRKIDPTPVISSILQQKILGEFRNTTAQKSDGGMIWRHFFVLSAGVRASTLCAACCAIAAVTGFIVGGISTWHEHDQAVEHEFAAYINAVEISLNIEDHVLQEAL